MSIVMEEDIKRWTAKRKTALVLEIIQGKTTVAEASRSFDLPPSEVEDWVDEAKRGMENALRAKPVPDDSFRSGLAVSDGEVPAETQRPRSHAEYVSKGELPR